MRKLIPFILAATVVISATIPMQSAITQQQAIQAVRNFIGDQNAQVSMTPGVTEMTTSTPSESFLDFWDDNNPYYDLTSGNYQYFVDGNSGLIRTVIVTSDLNVYPADALNCETMWARYSMMPRNHMQQPSSDTWVLRFPDGSWDPSVQLSFSRTDGGLVDQVTAFYTPVASTRPTITVTIKQAISIAKTIAGSYAWQGEDEIVYTYPYFDMEDADGVDWRTNDQGLPEPVYTITFIVSSDPTVSAAWINSESSHGMMDCATFIVYVNAANGSIVYSDGSEYLCSSETTGVKADTGLIGKQKSARLVPFTTLQALAGNHKLAATKGTKLLLINGKRMALPGRVISIKNRLYLPWQALNYIPGVKATYKAELNSLAISTTGKSVAVKMPVGKSVSTPAVKKAK